MRGGGEGEWRRFERQRECVCVWYDGGNGGMIEFFGWAADVVQGVATKNCLANQESS
jgi:hypothetical protein